MRRIICTHTHPHKHTTGAYLTPPKHTLPLATALFIPPDVSTALLHSPLAGGFSFVVAVVVIYNLYVVFSGFTLYMKSLSSEQRRRQGLICLVRGQGHGAGAGAEAYLLGRTFINVNMNTRMNMKANQIAS